MVVDGMGSHAFDELVSFLAGLPEPRILMDAEYRILAANAAYEREFGGGQRLVGRRCYEVSHRFDVPCDQAGESCPLRLSLESAQMQKVLHLHHTPRGEEHVLVETTPVRDESGKLAYFVETMHTLRQASPRPVAQGLVGRSPAFLGMLEKVFRVARSNASVLLLGETGTGKELIARAIHEASDRSDKPFVAVDCAGMTETLFEAELFGYEKGAFTGANFRKAGLVESAAGGTLFLDEIGELPLALQVRLLRLLETGTFRRVGGLEWLPADFRLLSATHRDLGQMVRSESFRRDLYFRINAFPIRVPALHERAEDIPLLAEALLARVDQRSGRRFTPAALNWLAAQRFSGNIRELRNLIERCSLLADADRLDVSHVRAALDDDLMPLPPPPAVDGFRLATPVSLSELEQRYLAWVAAVWQGSPEEMAACLGVSRRTLYRKQAKN